MIVYGSILVTRRLLIETSLIFEAIKNELIALEASRTHSGSSIRNWYDLGERYNSTGNKESVSGLWFPEGGTTVIFYLPNTEKTLRNYLDYKSQTSRSLKEISPEHSSKEKD